jgi:hypothetical protein
MGGANARPMAQSGMCGAKISVSVENTPDCANAARFGATRWLYPGYDLSPRL